MTEGGSGGRLRQEVIDNLSEISKALWQNPEYKRKQIQERKERAIDPDWLRKMKEINQERAKDSEYREKLSNAGKEIWQKKEYQENISKLALNKWQNLEHRENQLRSRSEGSKKISNPREFIGDILTMKKKDINTKYEMDGKCINRRIKEMLGHHGANNYTDAKLFLEDKNLNKIAEEINDKLRILDENKGVKKEIPNKEEFLKNIQEKQSKELCQYYGMDRTTLNRRIYEMLGDKEVKNFSEAKKYLENKDIKEIAEEINNNKKNAQIERYEGTTLISDKKQFFEDILNMQKKEIDMKYGLDAKTTNKKIEEILGDYGVKNYTGAKEYLKDNGVDEVLKTIENKEGEKESQDKPLEESDQTPEKVVDVEEQPKQEESEEKPLNI
ncbi:MAG: hypothetical protein KGD63_05425 [Candidatus Lokiarchaeota archaeon]|nr:hypothetical protein [Candidatus Lokiarchaeota archaeon]